MKNLFFVLCVLVPGLAATGPALAEDTFGEPLPADGGAPFAAYLQRLEAIHSADWDAFKHIAPPDEVRAQIAAAGGDAAAREEFEGMVEFMRMMTPSEASFVEGRADSGRARLLARTVRPTTELKGADAPVTITLVELQRVDGHWYVENETLHSIAE